MDLTLVRFPLVAPTPEPVLHSLNGGGGPGEDHGAEVSVRSAPHEPLVIVDLTLVGLPLVASTPEPVLHSMNGGGRPVEDQGAGDRVRSVPHEPQVMWTWRSCASRWSRPRRSRSCPA